ncbi:hypothetical protein chiPu_0025397, partial [Chiloscyllium punctatum]|nr:hypothetical protein [Chiloscyllium punctatum]
MRVRCPIASEGRDCISVTPVPEPLTPNDTERRLLASGP